MKISDTVAWIMSSDRILKLEKTGKTYDISDEVAKFLDSKGLFDKLDDQAVEVEIDETQGQDGTITRLLLKQNSEAEPEESKKEKQPESSDLVVKEVTVGGVSAKGGVKLKEDKENQTWYDLDSTIDIQKFKAECTGKVVEITIAPQDKGNDVIKGYILKDEEKKEDEPKKETGTSKKSYSNDTQTSIEAQASMNSANRIISQMDKILNDPEKVLTTITKIAKHNFKTIQDLKSKE